MLQRGVTVWFTGLSSAGKTTLSRVVASELRSLGYQIEILDDDLLRENLSNDLGFSKADRDENIREEVRNSIGNFIEVYVNASLDICEKRDIKGLYQKARAGQIKNFTGIDDPYEPPLNPTLECRTDLETIEESANKVLLKMAELGYINALSEKTNNLY
ncbi:adenylyl-sulfate kinase [Fischerella thermalis]|uniref:adenylyl-sulfate kinase n=1 Tax=Fischerella thermalis TaxID=372787 RepID=UPI0019E2BE0A|nr:adenylyl-sulfate kinase [Fischerella thermalis]MBF1991682.1 adenylyl-sulfate kinase [Fischerella thermalis M58_A2018_009]MBF2071945.1 adenylyl-sulfate kinase [Fischerella thermalis M48_A2018_028]